MSSMTRWEPGNLQVIMHQPIRLREGMVPAAKKLLLVVVAGSPGQHRADIQFLAADLAHHVVRLHTFRGILVVRAPGGMYVMVARIPAVFRGVDPALHGERYFAGTRRGYL